METLDDSEVRKNEITKSAQTTADGLSGGRLEQNPYFVPRMGLVVEGRKTPREFFSPQLYKISILYNYSDMELYPSFLCYTNI